MTLVVPLKALSRADLAVAGGKAANLGELVGAGFPVPGGFVVTTAAYQLVAPRVRIPAHPGESGGAPIRDQFEALEIPEAARHAIADGYAELGAGPVAVRSSATAEDLPGAAFAGQQDTYLNVVGEAAVVDAVRRCWGSLWTDRAIAYRAERGIDSAELSIAVVVQSMVDAELAGVMFTANPVTGDREQLVVDASSGLGEAVVSGLVTPDHYVLDRRGNVRDFTPGQREVVIRGAAGGGVRHEPGSEDAERLPDGALAELARLGVAVAEHFGQPQDIEWGYADGRLLLLQARPMTALPPPPVRLNPAQRKLGSILLEYLPVRPYPIDVTTWLPYGPAGLMAKVTEHFGIRGAFHGFLHEEDGVVDRMVPPSPRPMLGILRTPYRLASLARRYDPARWTDDPRFADFRAAVRELGAVDLPGLPWSELIRMPRRALQLIDPIADLRISYLPRSGLAILRVLIALRLLRRSALFGDVVLGAPTRTTDANHALEALATLVRNDPALAEAVAALDLDRLPEFGDFHAAFAAFLAEYGHRETESPLLVTPPTLGESPQIVLGLVQVLAAKPSDAAEPADRALEALLAHPRLRAPKRRVRMRRWVAAARAGIAFREDSHFYFTEPLPVLRRSLLEIGARLAGAGVLEHPEQVFHLRLEELEAVTDVTALSASVRDQLSAAVRQRTAKRDELTGVPLLDPGLVFPHHDDGDALVSGTPASRGRVTGAVRVIRSPAEFANLRAGEVLVCPYTNPSWTPLFPRAAAVVVDSGGLGSHAAIVAREYGIPAIMGTAKGTAVLTDGQQVTVDGSTGRVVAAEAS
ncbi:MAG: PEP/pyruvate-binding domain-containing protein [Micromonosporaceae bacterium]